MADPVTIVGAIAASVQLIELALHITQLIHSVYSEIRTAPAFVAERLVHIEQLIGIATVIKQSPALQTSEITGIVNVCLEKAKQINLKLKEALPGNSVRRWQWLMKSWVVIFGKRNLATLFENLERDKSSLTLAVQAVQPEIQEKVALQVKTLQSTATRIVDDTSTIPQLSRDIEGIHLLTPRILERVDAIHDSFLPQLVQQRLENGAKSPQNHISGQYNVPNRRVRGFVGREDYLQSMKEMVLHPVDSLPRIVVVQGMGGQGKTQLALEFCHRGPNDSLFSACFWVDATSESTARRSVETIFELVRPNWPEAQTGDARLRLIVTTLGSLDFSWLMVFDNYDDPVGFANVQEFIPESPFGTILFTTRHTDTETLASEGCAIQLGCLRSVEATKLLLRQSHHQSTNKNIQQGQVIAARLGCHALAITQAGTYIKRRRIPLDQFLPCYERQKRAILQEVPSMTQYRKTLKDAEIEVSLSVFTTWELSFQQLAANDRDGGMANILTLLAFFDPNNIPEVLFKKYCDGRPLDQKERYLFADCWHRLVTNPGDFEDSKESDVEICGDWNHDRFAEILGILGQLSLIQTYEMSGSDDYHVSLHPLVRDWIKLRISVDAACEYFQVAANILATMIEDMCDTREDKITQHQLALEKRWVIPHLIETNLNFQEIFEARSVPAPLNASRTFEVFAYSFYKWGRHKESHPWFERNLQYHERFHSSDSKQVERWLLDLVWNSIWMCDYPKAEVYARRLLSITQTKYPPGHMGNISAMDALASTLTETTRYCEAEAIFKDIVKRLEDSPTDRLEKSLSNLGWMLRLTKRDEEAEIVLRRAISLIEKRNGPDDLTSITVLGNHAEALFGLGRHAEAEQRINEMLERSDRMLGPDHHLTICGTYTLAAILFERGNTELAKPHCQNVLAWMTENYAPTHRFVVRSAELMAKINAVEKGLEVDHGMNSTALVHSREDSWMVSHP